MITHEQMPKFLCKMSARAVHVFFFSLLSLVLLAAVPAAEKDSADTTAAEDIAHWATLPANGPEGRPLPLTGSWVSQNMFGPRRMIELIRQGHHVLPTLGGNPAFMANYAYILDNKGFLNKKLPAYFEQIEPVLEYCAEHGLPISLGGGNWATGPARLEYDYNRAPEKNRRTFSPEESVRLMIRKDGEVASGSWKMSSPFGPNERWAAYGRWWMDNPAMQRVRELYPDPPMVVFLNNNEAGEIGVKHLDRSVRFKRQYGEDLSADEKKRILHRAYDEKYEVMLNAAREALKEPAWKKNATFVAYNAWPRSVKGRTEERNHPSEWKRFDGAMPEFYLNDWQIYRGKTDYSIWSPQTEALRIQSSQAVIFSLAPDYYFASIAWDGGQPVTRRSSVNCLATGMYGSGAVQRWDFARYEGMVQFGLWAMRPRVMREFRWPVHQHHAYDEGTFNAVVRAVDRPWNNETLRKFWRFGELVKSEQFEPPKTQVAKELRFYSRVQPLLPVDANPPRESWPRIWELKAGKRQPPKLRVLALALKLGKAPERRWLIYAHAPLGAVADAKVTLPDHGKVELPNVAKSGSFFVVDEPTGAVKTLLAGGPAEIDVNVPNRFIRPGEAFDVTARVTLPPAEGLDSVIWSHGDGETVLGNQAVTRRLALEEPGLHMIRVTGTTADGRKVADDAPVFVGEKPEQSVVYDLELSDASVWRGTWDGVGEDQRERLTYRMVPNPGAAPDIVLHGGRFVDDTERGRVLELSHDYEGLWGVRSRLTCNHPEGYPNFAVSLRFKAETTDGTQVLYVQGGRGKGFNIYIRDGTLYAGSMSGKRDWSGLSNNEKGKNGYWLRTDKVEAGRWHHVALVLADATREVQPEKLSLFLDGEKIGSGPGVRVPNHHAGPRIGLARTTTLHTGENISHVGFRGRIADFRQVNAAVVPGR